MPQGLLNNRLVNITAGLFLICILGWLLVIGRDILIPLIIAIVIWYVLDTVARYFQSISFGGFHVPRMIAVLLALAISILLMLFVMDMIATNALALAKDAPSYQLRIEAKINYMLSLFSSDMKLDMSRFNDLFNLERLVSWVVSAVSGFLGIASLVVIYIIFIVSEQAALPKKIIALFTDPQQRTRVNTTLDRLDESIRTYLTVKTFVSILTGVLCYTVLSIFDVNYPAFWGFITFLLNYIPTIGSLIAVVFPALLSLVQFDSYLPFLGVTIVLTTIQFSIGNILEPYLMGSKLNLSGLVIILALAVWGAIWGITGMILSVPIMVIIMLLLSASPTTRPIAILLSSNGAVEDYKD
ncbi:Predicted PurR-regulated permease PerM [Thiothrix eikelboomii]|uniref:Predicted PurR-regulated permease PerM n=1 Tax=Thiothrix eikelboomii TaxID=92487 RepID=A0A1T4VVH0_9GAMM|nr:AI-2E family transporter [Thiothrix eikelboomii]SKA68818.1 Predicted PurR-regulated permease PerM [Thiothrix eikelboomii]